MTLRTITFDDSTHKLVPIIPTVEMMTGCFDGISLSDAHSPYGVEEHVYLKMIAAAPEYQDIAQSVVEENGKLRQRFADKSAWIKLLKSNQDTKKDE